MDADWVSWKYNSTLTLCTWRLSDPTGWGLSPTRLSHFRWHSQGHVVTCASDLPAINWWFLWSLLRFKYFTRAAYRSQTFTYFYEFIIKDMIKDKNEQPDEEVHRVKFRRTLSTGVSVPMKLRYITLPACGYIHQCGSPSTVVVQEFL